MINIHAVLIAYALSEELKATARQLVDYGATIHLYLHSRIPKVVDACEELGRWPHVDYYPYGVNRGLAVSWNDVLFAAREAGADTTLLVNDDVLMKPADLDVLVGGALDHPEAGAVVCEGVDGNDGQWKHLNFVIVAINPSGVERVGYFDEMLVPYCFEDSDWSRRAGLLGVTFHNAGPTSIYHIGSQSQTVSALAAQNQRTFPASHAYYAKKHGGLIGSETFIEHPFNDPALSWHIGPDERHDPYPQHRRTDLEMIKL